MLLERDQQLDDLRVFADGTAALGGGVVLVGGEAGIGKTSLVREFVAGRGEPVLTGSCEPLSTPRPLQPLHDLAHQAGGRLAVAMASDASRHDRFTALLELLGEAPTVAVIEDVHWADEATLDLLVFLGRRLGETQSLLVLTFREHSPEAPPRLAEVLGHLATRGRAVRIGLPPLSIEAVAVLADGGTASAARVHAATAGNPFFVTEVLASGTDDVPASVRDVVLGRAAHLGDGARAVLEAAAVVPDRVELALLYAASGSVPQDLQECERVDLLEVGPRFATYRHELARMAVLDSLPAVRRQQLHAAVVAHLLTRPGHLESRIAHHADLAGDSATVLTHAVLAADQAARMGAHREAAAQMDRALAHLDAAEPGVAARILDRAAQLFQPTGRLEDALDASGRAVELLRTEDQAELASVLATHARVLWVVARGEESRAAIDEAVEIVTSLPGSAGEVHVLATAAALYMLAREIPRAFDTGRRAIALARERGDAVGLMRALNAVGAASWFAVPDEAEPLLVESLEIARRLHDDVGVAHALVNLGSGAGEIRRYDVARRWLEENREFSAARDLDHSRDYSTAWLARIALEQGDWDRALDLAESVPDTTDPISRIASLAVAGKVRLRRGESNAANQLDEAWELARGTGHLQRLWPVAAGLAEQAWRAGSSDQIPALVTETLELARTLGQPWAVGELGWWLTRAGGPAPQQDEAAAAYVAMAESRWDDAATLWDELGCPWEAALCRSETADPTASSARRRSCTGSARVRTPRARRSGCAGWDSRRPPGHGVRRQRTRQASPTVSSRSPGCSVTVRATRRSQRPCSSRGVRRHTTSPPCSPSSVCPTGARPAGR